MLMNVVFSTSLTRSPIGKRFVTLMSMLKYVGPFNEFSGKLPKVPGVGPFNANIPGLIVELMNLPPSGLPHGDEPLVVVLMHNSDGSIKNIPDGVLNTPVCFLNSSNDMPISWAGLLPELKLLNVFRP